MQVRELDLPGDAVGSRVVLVSFSLVKLGTYRISTKGSLDNLLGKLEFVLVELFFLEGTSFLICIMFFLSFLVH